METHKLPIYRRNLKLLCLILLAVSVIYFCFTYVSLANHLFVCEINTAETSTYSYSENPELLNSISLLDTQFESLPFLTDDMKRARSQCLTVELALLDNVIKSHPERRAFYYKRARIYLRMGDYTSRISVLHKILEIEPRDVVAYQELASAYESNGQLEKALYYYQKSLQYMEQSSYWTEKRSHLMTKYRWKVIRLEQKLN